MMAYMCPHGEHLIDLTQCFSVSIVDFKVLNADWDNAAAITRLLFNKNAKKTYHYFINNSNESFVNYASPSADSLCRFYGKPCCFF